MNHQKERIAAFLQRVEQDPAVRREVEAVMSGSKSAVDVTEVAARHGYAFTADAFLAAVDDMDRQPGMQEGDLDDVQLDDIAGGAAYIFRGHIRF